MTKVNSYTVIIPISLNSEPVQLTGEIIASSLQDDMYQFSAPSVRGTTPYTYKWFINSIENTSTDSTLTIRLSNSLTTVMVSVSNHQDLTNTTFTVNRTAIVNPRPLMCKLCNIDGLCKIVIRICQTCMFVPTASLT